MLKLFYERIKDQTGFGLTAVLIVASLVITGLGLWSVGTEAKKTIDNKKELASFVDKNNSEDPEAYQEQLNKALVKAAYNGGKIPITVVAGVHDTYLVNTALDAAGAFDTENKKNEKLDPLLLSDDEANRLMQLTEDELDRIVEEMDLTDLLTGDEIDISFSDDEIDRLLEETGNLDYGIKKVVERKVELNSDSGTTPQEKKTIVDETIKNIQKAEDNNNKVDLNSWVQTILKGTEKLADQKLIDLRKALIRSQLSYDYNIGIIEKYEEYQAKGQGISDPSELAEAKRRLEDINNETKIIEAQIKELEGAKQISPESTVAETTPETNTQPTETTPETNPDTALPSELNLKGNIICSLWGCSIPLTLNINFETQEVTGTFSYSGPFTYSGPDPLGKFVQITFSGTINGTVNGWINNSKQIRATYTWDETDVGWGPDDPYSFTGDFLGSLDENNKASGQVITDPAFDWTASPY